MKDWIEGVLSIIGGCCGCSVMAIGIAGTLMLLVKALIAMWLWIF